MLELVLLQACLFEIGKVLGFGLGGVVFGSILKVIHTSHSFIVGCHAWNALLV